MVSINRKLPKVLNSRELAIVLDLSPDSVNTLARRGFINGYKVGRQWRFRRKDVEGYIQKIRRNPEPGEGGTNERGGMH